MYKDPKIPKNSKVAKVPIVLNFAQTINTAQMYSVKTVKYSKIHLKIEFENCLKFSLQRPNCRFSIKNVYFGKKCLF